ncbi:hypothetical protein MUK42_37562 [Musa troglodytarum]|uniref:Uncharacterized protein n=1 Tax=Musa troglodytarum TaxID=320322 RepID=A0A9E7GVS1_9LILI|nr:hypothetical protein MUK42_37562 [Musa troglodytarum]
MEEHVRRRQVAVDDREAGASSVVEILDGTGDLVRDSRARGPWQGGATTMELLVERPAKEDKMKEHQTSAECLVSMVWQWFCYIYHLMSFL